MIKVGQRVIIRGSTFDHQVTEIRPMGAYSGRWEYANDRWLKCTNYGWIRESDVKEELPKKNIDLLEGHGAGWKACMRWARRFKK
jgi:hypothetical protein